ncbi:multicopper oxidase domain-containing protein [Streptomyces sp. NPDC047453]|uniref:multicopper oxidase domain-containing protein n=1 Tax=Streptomyces sp. NPDC047453 TaxID=3154812 RepID=UPI0033CD4D21
MLAAHLDQGLPGGADRGVGGLACRCRAIFGQWPAASTACPWNTARWTWPRGCGATPTNWSWTRSPRRGRLRADRRRRRAAVLAPPPRRVGDRTRRTLRRRRRLLPVPRGHGGASAEPLRRRHGRRGHALRRGVGLTRGRHEGAGEAQRGGRAGARRGQALARPELGQTEVWRFTTNFHHPVHLHLDHFQVVSRNNREPGAYDHGWKGTVALRPAEAVEVVVRFTDYTGPFHVSDGLRQPAAVCPRRPSLPDSDGCFLSLVCGGPWNGGVRPEGLTCRR